MAYTYMHIRIETANMHTINNWKCLDARISYVSILCLMSHYYHWCIHKEPVLPFREMYSSSPFLTL